MFPLCYLVLYKKFKQWQFVTCKDIFMRVKSCNTLSSEMFIKKRKEKKNTSADYTKTDLLTQRLVVQSVDWDENDLLFIKRLQVISKVISYSHARTIMNINEIYSKH